MLLQTNIYVVPKEKRDAHARLMRQFRQTMLRLGCDQFEVYEQVEANWAVGESSDRYVQIMRFRDRHHQRAVQLVEKQDPIAQQLISEFCDMIDFPQQQEQGLFTVSYYQSVLPTVSSRVPDASEKDHDLPARPTAGEENQPKTLIQPPDGKPTSMSGMNVTTDKPLPLNDKQA